MSLVTVEKLSKVYRQGQVEVQALHDVSLQIAAGEFVALAGPSGSGKTTLLNLMGALDVPSQGEIYLEGKPLSQYSATQLSQLRRDKIGFIFQSYNLIPVLTALENAEYVLLLQGVEKAKRRELVMQMLAAVGLAGLEQRFPNELSGGQQQRVAIARAIVARPAIVLADEPTANLDSKTAEQLLQTMRQLNDERKCTFIFSTHDPRVMNVAKRLVHLQDGKIVSEEQH